MIRFDDVAVRYPRAAAEALSGVSLEAKRGILTAIVGPNGSGKSTLVRALIGRIATTRGRIEVDGIDVAAIDRASLARRVAVVTQKEELAFPVAVSEYVALGRFPHLGIWHAAGDADRAAPLPSMTTVVLDAQLNAREEVGALLGGSRSREQRVAQATLYGGHAITAAVVSASGFGSNCDSNLPSSESRPRLRWVFTEFREIPSVAAMSSMPSSS